MRFDSGLVAALLVPQAAPPACRMCARTPALAAPARSAAQPVAFDDEAWIDALDLKAFGAEVRSLGRRLAAGEGEADVRHFRKLRQWSDACAAVGLATMALPLNPLSVVALSTWTYSRWAMIAHHTCHGGYDRHGDRRFRGASFALGSTARRVRDWASAARLDRKP